ncbi:MAG TPA: hypothetical protein VGI46_17420 [Candidatus Acidoferrum sp.]|jgi:hypothetical protein
MGKLPSKPVAAKPPIEIQRAIIQDINEMSLKEQERIRTFGHVRPEIAQKFSGYQFVAVGKKLFYSKDWKSFHDFLVGYTPAIFGKEWWENETHKPVAAQNQVVGWREAMRRYAMAKSAAPDEARQNAENPFSLAYMTFAYDLYVVAHNGRLDDTLVARLKNRDQFQGARHELFAEATCLRAGFAIQRENERDKSTKHAEFLATHKQSGLKFSVEAKSKHRAGVLGMPGIPLPHHKLSLSFGQLINSALAKNPPHPLVVFIDTNLPTRWAQRLYAPRIEKDGQIPSRLLMALLDRVAKEHGGNDPYALLIFSNHPLHHFSPDELDPQKNLLVVTARNSPLNLRAGIEALFKASNLYGNIPRELPEQR